MEILTPVRCKAQDYIRNALVSSGPLDLEELAAELKHQCSGVDSSNAAIYATLALADLIQFGEVEQYENELAFDLSDECCDRLEGKVDNDPCYDDEGKNFESIKYRL